MNTFGIILISILSLSGARPEPGEAVRNRRSPEILAREIFSREACQLRCSKRFRNCDEDTNDCGGCFENYISHDGECQPDFIPDQEIDDLAYKANGRKPHYKLKDEDSLKRDEESPRELRNDDDIEVKVPDIPAIPDFADKPILEYKSPNVKIHNVHHAPEDSLDDKLMALHTVARLPMHPPTPLPRQHIPGDDLHPVQSAASMADVYFLAVVAGCSVAGLIGLVFAGVCWYRLQKNVKAASEVEYPAYGITGPTKERAGSPGDRKLAQSAQMYHYQHQKQQMIALEKATGEMKQDGSEEESEEENEEGDYTVYECPGLAPTGEMEVKNPLFSEETPVTPTPDSPPSDQGAPHDTSK